MTKHISAKGGKTEEGEERDGQIDEGSEDKETYVDK